MTVKDMIKGLNKFPPDLEITVVSPGNDAWDSGIKHVNRMLSHDKSYDRLVICPMGAHVFTLDKNNDEIGGFN